MDYFACMGVKIGDVQINTSKGKLFQTFHSLCYYSKSMLIQQKTRLLFRLVNITSISEKSHSIQITHENSKTSSKQTVFIAFPDKQSLSRAFSIISRQWKLILQSERIPLIGVLVCFSFLLFLCFLLP